MSIIGSAVCAGRGAAAMAARNPRRESISERIVTVVWRLRLPRLWLLIPVLCSQALAADVPTLDDALNHLYNFRFKETQEIIDKIIAAKPQAPLPYAFRAAGYLFSEL